MLSVCTQVGLGVLDLFFKRPQQFAMVICEGLGLRLGLGLGAFKKQDPGP